jgi:peptidoglycan L-alanyl-D-glutamate endopeptidase CwlK
VPRELLGKVDLDKLAPYFVDPLLEVLARCRAKGANYYLSLGFRSASAQAKLWAQGRTQPGPVVTNAGPFESWHCYGLAADCVRDADMVKVGLQPAWASAGYDLLRDECAKLGLQAGLTRANGSRWDEGHVQFPVHELTGKAEIVLSRGLKPVFLSGADETAGLRAAWDEFAKILPSKP